MRKFIAKVTACVLAAATFSLSAGAEVYYDVTYPWMDDVYRLDLTNADGAGESVTYEENVLCMLGVMSRNAQGRFEPNKKLSKAAYEAAVRVIYSGEKVDFAKYEETYENQKVYQKEVVKGLLQLIENTEIEDGADIKQLADTAGILKGVTYSAAKEMTRHDFAVIAWNTLNSEYVQYKVDGEYIDIKVEDGKTILNDRFDVYEVKGMLNAIAGLNIYSAQSPQNEYIEIDRVTYNAMGFGNLDELLGRTVRAYARHNEKTDEFELLNVEVDKKDETVTFDLRDFESLDERYLSYSENSKLKKVKISEMKNVIYNGDFVNGLNKSMFDGFGTVLVSKSKKNGDYDTAIIKNYSHYLVKRYLASDRKLYLSYGAKFGGENWIDLDIDEGTVVCEIEGVRSIIDSLKQNMPIAVIQNKAKTYTEIIAANQKIKGSVLGNTEDGWMIEGEEYFLDKQYDDLSRDSSNGAGVVKIGAAGTFYVTADNVIVGFEPEGSAQFGLLRRAWCDDIDDEILYVRIFTMTGEWKNFELTKRVEVDGKKVDSAAALTKIQDALTKFKSPTPIRYKLTDDKVRFIDTLIDDPAEALDNERMIKSGSFSGKTSWVKGWDMGTTADCHVSDATPMFVVPSEKDRDKEDKYSVTLGSAIPSDTVGVSFEAYNADKFKCARLAILNGEAETASGDGVFIYIKDVTERVVDDEIVTGVDCWLFTRGKVELDERFYEIPENWQESWGVTSLKNCFVEAAISGTEITKLSFTPGRYVKDFKVAPNASGKTSFFDRETSRNNDWVAGTIIDTDPARNYMLVDCGEDGVKSVVNAVFVMGRVEKGASKVKVEGITTDAVNPGDKVFYLGSLRRAYYILIMPQ